MAVACVPNFAWAWAIVPAVQVIVPDSPNVGVVTRPLLFATTAAARHVTTPGNDHLDDQSKQHRTAILNLCVCLCLSLCLSLLISAQEKC